MPDTLEAQEQEAAPGAPATDDEHGTPADTDDEPGTPETDDEPGTAPAGPDTRDDEAMAQVFDKARKRADTYMKAVPDILGAAAADLSLCPRCTDLLPGFVLPPQVKPVVGDQLVAVKLSIGEGVERPLRQDRRAFVCDDCDGEGKVLTGSHVRGQDKLKCENCNGRGWVGPRSATIGATAAGDNGYSDSAAEAVPEEKPAVDPWGRMKGDPLYGVFPGFEPE